MAGLVADVLYHVVIGLALAAVVWGVGAGWVRGRGDWLDGYAVGLLVVTVAAFLFLVSPWLGIVGLSLLAPIIRARVRIGTSVIAWSAPAVLCLPVVLGLMQHGPTRTLPSAANGENLWWASRIWSAAASVVPYRDLLAEGQHVIYTESAPSFIGGALTSLPGFDPILFHTTALPAFLLVSLIAGLRMLRAGGADEPAWIALLGLIALTTVIYPTFVTESGPVPLAVPLAFVVYRLWEQRPPFARLTLIGSLVAVDLLLTKVIGLVAVGIVLAFVLYARYWRRLDARRRAAVFASLAAGAAAVIVILFLTAAWYRHLFSFRFLPGDAVRGLWSQHTQRNAGKVAPTFEIVGQLALLVALVRARADALAVALAVSVAATWFLGGQAVYMSLGFATLWAAIFFWRRPVARDRQRTSLVVAALALGAWSWLQDISGVRLAALLIALALLPVVVGLARTPSPILLGALAGIAVAALAAGSFRLEDRYDSYIPADYDVWKHVRGTVPEDGLVFTSLTGRVVELHQGWDNYPAIARRQLYIAGWYDGRLVAQTSERNRRLALNREVLTGARSPAQLSYAQRFGSFWAVMRRSDHAPPAFHRIYANDEFALYRIES